MRTRANALANININKNQKGLFSFYKREAAFIKVREAGLFEKLRSGLLKMRSALFLIDCFADCSKGRFANSFINALRLFKNASVSQQKENKQQYLDKTNA